MDKISINSLAGLETNKNINTNTLDINSLANASNNLDSNFSADQLVKSKQIRREKLLTIYKYYYKSCLDKIKMVNLTDKTDLVYTIPIRNAECPNYSASDCIDYIDSKLQEHKLDTLKMSKNSLFITWKYLELKL
jgi:hypothetical protein